MKASIIIPVHNCVEYTKKCMESIKQSARSDDYEIIVINNASDDETKDFLKKTDALVINNKENVGVAKAWNQGIRKAKGEFLFIINNDIIVCKNFIENMIDFYEKEKNTGIASPGTKEGELNYDFNFYSENFVKKMKNVKEKGFCGWCMLIKKDRFEKVGLFSEEYNIGIGEDTDFYFRLKKMGFESYITGAAFIHHFGSKTLNELKNKIGNDFEKENIKKLKIKWGIKERNYIMRKIINFKKFIKNLYLRIFYGYTLIS